MLTVNLSPLQETLSSVATWLDSHPKEIVILACCNFEGIDDNLHKAFIFSLKKLFGSKLCPQNVSFLLVQLIYGESKDNIMPYETYRALHRNQSWPCGVCGHLVTRLSCPMTPILQWGIRSCGLPSPTGGPTSAQHKKLSATWTGTKAWDVQVSFIYTLASSRTFTAPSGASNTEAYYVCFLVCVHEHTMFSVLFIFQRASSSLAWTWRLTGVTSRWTWSNPCGRWPSVTGSVWGSGWRSSDPGRTPRASTSLLETLWVHSRCALWSSHWTKNF